MAYSLKFNNQAFNALEKIDDPSYSKIKTALQNLTINPRPHGYKKLIDRKGYRIRVGNYRIIYDIIDEILIVEVITIGHRKDVYG
ncbi:MAG: type II toxin-antitoxin system RelE/ParE family toxin [Saprospiraceae bacterium]